MFKRRKPDDSSAAGINDPFAPGADAVVETAGNGVPATRSDLPGAPLRASDPGLGVPPFRPAPPKEAPAMGRAPFTPNSASAPVPPAPTPIAPAPAQRPQTGPSRGPGREPAERRTLVVGRGISVQGIVQDAERLVVEGTVEATMIHAHELEVAPGGVFKGEVEVEEAQVAGTIDGTLTARGSLIVRASGRLLGTARCRRLQVEDGGQITGRIEMITEAQRPVEPQARPAEATS